jgi:ABC-2 type transport system permease protein
MTAVRFGDIAASEWTKIRSVRSTAWSFVAMGVVSVVFSVLVTSVYTGKWDHLSADDRTSVVQDPIGLILQPGAAWGQIAMCVLGVLIFAGEYSSGMIRATMLAVPRRIPVLAGKIAVLAALTFAVSEIVAFGSFFVGQAILRRHVPVSLGDPDVLRAIVGYGLYLALVGVLAVSVGAAVRHVAGAIVLMIGLTLVLPTVSSGLPGKLGRYLSTYLPSPQAALQIMSTGRGGDAVVSPWQGFGVGCAWTALAVVLAAWLLNRRDV